MIRCFLLLFASALFAGDFSVEVKSDIDKQKLMLTENESSWFDAWEANHGLSPSLESLIKFYLNQQMPKKFQDDLLGFIKEQLSKIPVADNNIKYVEQLLR